MARQSQDILSSKVTQNFQFLMHAIASIVSKASKHICLNGLKTASFHFALEHTDQHSALCILNYLQ